MRCTQCAAIAMATYLDSAFNGKIYCYEWEAITASPKAVVLIYHGYAEHCRRYDRQAEIFIKDGFAVVAADMFGHGHSDGQKGHFPSLEPLLKDAEMVALWVKERYPDLPLLAFTHSFGSGVHIEIAIRHPSLFHGSVLIAPLCTPDTNANTVVNRILLKVLKWMFPSLAVAPMDRDHLTHDEAWHQSIAGDEFCYNGRLTAGAGGTMLELMNQLQLEKFSLPVLVMHGEDDVLVNPKCSRTLQATCTSTDATFKFYEGAYHQLHNEKEEIRLPVMNDVLKWLNAHI